MPEKIKLFAAYGFEDRPGFADLETRMNEWFAKNPQIEITHRGLVLEATPGGQGPRQNSASGIYTTVFIYYRDQ